MTPTALPVSPCPPSKCLDYIPAPPHTTPPNPAPTIASIVSHISFPRTCALTFALPSTRAAVDPIRADVFRMSEEGTWRGAVMRIANVVPRVRPVRRESGRESGVVGERRWGSVGIIV